MNYIGFFIILISAKFALACPNLSGTYRYDKGGFSTYLKIQQNECISITLIPGPLKKMGDVPGLTEWSEINKYTVLLDGTIHPSNLKISMQFEGTDLVESYSWSPSFGIAIYRQDQAGNLNITNIESRTVSSSSQIDRNLPGFTGTWLKVP